MTKQLIPGSHFQKRFHKKEYVIKPKCATTANLQEN